MCYALKGHQSLLEHPLYHYAANSPTNLIDPTGQIVWTPIIIWGLIGVMVTQYTVGVITNDGYPYNPEAFDDGSGKAEWPKPKPEPPKPECEDDGDDPGDDDDVSGDDG